MTRIDPQKVLPTDNELIHETFEDRIQFLLNHGEFDNPNALLTPSSPLSRKQGEQKSPHTEKKGAVEWSPSIRSSMKDTGEEKSSSYKQVSVKSSTKKVYMIDTATPQKDYEVQRLLKEPRSGGVTYDKEEEWLQYRDRRKLRHERNRQYLETGTPPLSPHRDHSPSVDHEYIARRQAARQRKREEKSPKHYSQEGSHTGPGGLAAQIRREQEQRNQVLVAMMTMPDDVSVFDMMSLLPNDYQENFNRLERKEDRSGPGFVDYHLHSETESQKET